MTFDELMNAHAGLISKAAQFDFEHSKAAIEAKRELSEALKTGFLNNLFEGEKLDKAASVLTDELISRYRIPNGSGAGNEDGFGSGFSDHGDIDQYADQDPPEPVSVSVRMPGSKEEAIAYAKR